MTNAEVMAQILSEASGKPVEEVQQFVAELAKGFGSRTKLNVELSEADAAELLRALRKELPGIRQWLIEGALAMQYEIEHGTKH